MKIERLKLNNFMIFDELDIQWSPNIHSYLNIIKNYKFFPCDYKFCHF